MADLAAAEQIRENIDLALREPRPRVDAEDLVRQVDTDMYRSKTRILILIAACAGSICSRDLKFHKKKPVCTGFFYLNTRD